ncbi:MAG: alternative ribosome rescue aminoacyl-tRNA hydrolase ArfB [Spirochaetales bacterium]
MNEEFLREWIGREAGWEFSRSGGPGGQNVNKVNTRATLRLAIGELPLDEASKDRVREKLANRITSDDELLIHASEGRSQRANRRAAVYRAASLICAALRRQKRRKPTRPSKGAKERRIGAKKVRGRHKQNRRPPQPE